MGHSFAQTSMTRDRTDDPMEEEEDSEASKQERLKRQHVETRGMVFDQLNAGGRAALMMPLAWE
eukprot:CAMPEP_0172821300 /NCGR_PEP_ID=MMETSP1075-20121228/15854_1 /TAXON_ID=2916 /ORGANISM="Ceratium fusus, Strain PA161109" /LENGTH=63 /DNA_ID=CAMNT_0013662107 /DNA_START=9 /DNA_END=201 /DNA_ORIENTATION=-